MRVVRLETQRADIGEERVVRRRARRRAAGARARNFAAVRTLREVAEIVGLSVDRVYEVERNALKKLRAGLVLSGLEGDV